MVDPIGGTVNPFVLTTDIDPATGGVSLMITATFDRRDQMRMGSLAHLVDHLLGALDDAVEMWKKETR